MLDVRQWHGPCVELEHLKYIIPGFSVPSKISARFIILPHYASGKFYTHDLYAHASLNQWVYYNHQQKNYLLLRPTKTPSTLLNIKHSFWSWQRLTLQSPVVRVWVREVEIMEKKDCQIKKDYFRNIQIIDMVFYSECRK